jgi:hypothetical protein
MNCYHLSLHRLLLVQLGKVVVALVGLVVEEVVVTSLTNKADLNFKKRLT